MTMFSITGLRHGKDGDIERTVTWTDGELSGDAGVIEVVQRLAIRYEGHWLKPIVGRASNSEHLKNPYVACMLIKSVFLPRTTTQIGSLPKIKLPPGAIA